MTDKRKIKHVVAVLSEIESRMDRCQHCNHTDCFTLHNILDLRHLLEKLHKTEQVSLKFTQDSEGLAVLLYNQIKSRKPNFRQPNIEQWASDFDKIIRLDNRAVAQIRELVLWCRQNSFWSANILSPAKLRKQLDMLELQMSNDRNWQRGKLQRRQNRTGPTEREKYLKTLEGEGVGETTERCNVD